TDDTTGLTVPVGQGLSGRVAATGEPAIVEDLEPVDVATPALRRQVRSVLAVPLHSDSGVLGVVHVGTLAPRRFGEDDLRLLRLLAERVARAVERARLYSAEQQARSTAERT